MVLVRAVLFGLFIAIVGEMALAVVYLANLFLFPGVPWGVAPAAVFMVLFWRHLSGVGRSPEEARERRVLLRAGRLGRRGWAWAAAAIGAALVGLRSLATLLPAAAPAAVFPQLPLARLGEHDVTLWAIFVTNYLLFAPLIEEAAFRGYMQVPIELGYGPWVAVAVVAAVFTLLHAGRGMPLIYLALALFLGCLAYRAGTIWPGVLAHGTVNLWALFPGWRVPLGRLAPAAAGAPSPWAAAGLTALCALLAAAALRRLGTAVAAARAA